MRESGSVDRQVAKENCFFPTATHTKVIGRMTKLQGLVALFLRLNVTLVNGKTTYIMVRAKNSGKMAQTTSVLSLQVKRTDTVFINGPTRLLMKGAG